MSIRKILKIAAEFEDSPRGMRGAELSKILEQIQDSPEPPSSAVPSDKDERWAKYYEKRTELFNKNPEEWEANLEALENKYKTQSERDWEKQIEEENAAEEERANQEGNLLKSLLRENDKTVMATGPVSQVKIPDQTDNRKPKGIWYACGPEWIDWHMRAGADMDHYNHLYTIKISGNILYINNLEKLAAFDKKYGKNVDAYEILAKYTREELANLEYYDQPQLGNIIDWVAVAKDYDGIEICPSMPKRKSPDWYDGWDIASGCIWSKSGLGGVQLIAKRDESGEWQPVRRKKQEPIVEYRRPAPGRKYDSP